MTFDGTFPPSDKGSAELCIQMTVGVGVSQSTFLRRRLLSDQIKADLEAKANHAPTTFVPISHTTMTVSFKIFPQVEL